MSMVNREKFLQGLAKSKILKEDSLKEWLAGFGPEVESKELALDLVSKKLLTFWQAKMLLKGAWRLKFGNYLLTDRIDRTEFGDRFAATHRQLSRDVFIQYLPTAFSDSPESRRKVFSLGSKLSELDHPNLVHVYDVDEERKRVYLVSEAAKGKGLKELLEESPTLSCAAVAQIVRGCLDGVSYAHSKGIGFGSISPETVVVRPNGEPKICGLTKFAVRNELAKSPATESDDLAAVKSVADSLLGTFADSDRDSDRLSKLKIAIGSIEKEPQSAISMLNELIRLEKDSSGDIKLAPESPRAAATAHPATATARAATVPDEDEVAEPMFEESEGYLTSLAKRNPVALMAVSALTALLLIGGTVFAATQLVAAPAALADAGVESAAEKTQSKKATKVERTDFAKTKGALSTDVPNSTPATVTDPTANLAAIDAIFNKQSAEPAPIEVVKGTPTAAEPKKRKGRKRPKRKPAKAKDDVKESPKEMASATPAAAEPKMETKAEPAKHEQEFLEAGADPFKSFATVVDLPETSNTKQISFGKLILEKRHLLGAEILATEAVHRSKPMFEIMRSSDHKQTWEISLKKKRKSAPVIVAKLQKTAKELKFNWVAGAAELEAANYLRNCKFKIATPSHSHWMTLRKPIKIEGFMIGKEKGQTKIDFEIPYLPNPLAITGAISVIKFNKLNKSDRNQKAHLEPASITASSPARMYFEKDADRFLSLDVALSSNRKMALQAALVMQPKGQVAVILEDPSKIKQVCQQIRLAAQQAERVAAQAKLAKSQKQITKDEEKVYAAAAKTAADQAERTEYYEHLVPQLVEKDIPVLITYDLSEGHSIILAYTVESADTKKK